MQEVASEIGKMPKMASENVGEVDASVRRKSPRVLPPFLMSSTRHSARKAVLGLSIFH